MLFCKVYFIIKYSSRVTVQVQFCQKLFRCLVIILPVGLYGSETWSLTLRVERRLMVFENMVLRSIFWPKRDAVAGELRKLSNEKLNDLYSSPILFG